jgi:hypothetical protein
MRFRPAAWRRQIRIVAAATVPYRGGMVLRLGLEPPNLVMATIAGIVTLQEQAELVAFVRSAIAVTGSVRVLLCLESFAGWHPDAHLDSDDLWLRDDEGVSKIAIVGPQGWKATVMTLLAQPIRRVPIAYFVMESAARSWLELHAERSGTPVSA